MEELASNKCNSFQLQDAANNYITAVLKDVIYNEVNQEVKTRWELFQALWTKPVDSSSGL